MIQTSFVETPAFTHGDENSDPKTALAETGQAKRYREEGLQSPHPHKRHSLIKLWGS
jgi:hypothetical protein